MQHLTPSEAVDDSTNTKSTVTSISRPDRPCDACRRRKTRCVVNASNSNTCVMCDFHKQACTFVEDTQPRKRKAPGQPEDEGPVRQRRSLSGSQAHERPANVAMRSGPPVDNYANLQGKSLLKKTLGLQSHRHAKVIGAADQREIKILNLREYDDIRGESTVDDDNSSTFRKVGSDIFFHQTTDESHPTHSQELEDLDKIEGIVAPHGRALIRLYFRIVHPSFPILHKKVYLEKYDRSYREFSPPLLAAVYLLALDWWSYSSELAKKGKPSVEALESIASRTLHDVASYRPKLSTVQAGLLLLQRPKIDVSSWPITTLMVGVGQDLGLHFDCSEWRIPAWERGLRKRLAWALFIQDVWSAMALGRPPHIAASNWAVQTVTSRDFPESAADEDDEEGSTEVEKGRALFSAMISLSRILSELLEALYSLKAESEIQSSHDGAATVLTRAKPIQLKLRAWYAEIPGPLRMGAANLKVGKLDSVGCLHLAYFATEIGLHRQIIRSMSHNTDPYLIQVCRSAAKARLNSAIEFFDQLRPEHFQSFWHSASKYNFALIGSFAGLCQITATSRDEGEFYQRQLQEYRWKLRVSNRSADFLEISSQMLDSAVDPLLSRTSISQGEQQPNAQPTTQENDENSDSDDERPRNAWYQAYDQVDALNDFFTGYLDTYHDQTTEA